jgi:hypothetical protein
MVSSQHDSRNHARRHCRNPLADRVVPGFPAALLVRRRDCLPLVALHEVCAVNSALSELAANTLLVVGALFPIVNPLGNTPIFLTLTRDLSGPGAPNSHGPSL